MLTLTALCVGVVHIAGGDVYGVILPALGVQLLDRQRLLHLPGAQAGQEGEPPRRLRDALRSVGPAHVHRRVRDHVADVPGHQRPDRGLAGRSGLVFHHRPHRAAGRVRRPGHPQVHPAGGHARHPGGHLDRLHLDAPGGADVEALWIALPVLVIILVGFFTDLKLPGQHPDRPGGPARRLGHRLDRRLHGARRRRRGRQRHRDRAAHPRRSTCWSTG